MLLKAGLIDSACLDHAPSNLCNSRKCNDSVDYRVMCGKTCGSCKTTDYLKYITTSEDQNCNWLEAQEAGCTHNCYIGCISGKCFKLLEKNA